MLRTAEAKQEDIDVDQELEQSLSKKTLNFMNSTEMEGQLEWKKRK